ncbi:unnamed protein product, partial [Laminaria digitata]
MVVGMPNVGKSSLINLLRGKAERAQGRGGGGGGEAAKQVARVGAMPGVTRQVSAFRIASNPPLYLVDTPGVMVPRVEKATQGLYLALTRAVPDASVPPDILVGFMLRIVRSRILFGSQKKSSLFKEEDDMEELLEAVERESGAEGKPDPEMRRMCCRFVLDAFRDGHFGRITLDDVP